jgi:hypothetical protein
MVELRNEITNTNLSPTCAMAYSVLVRYFTASGSDPNERYYKSRSAREVWDDCEKGISVKSIHTDLEELRAARWVNYHYAGRNERYQALDEREHNQRVASVILRATIARILDQHSALPEDLDEECSTPWKFGLKRLVAIVMQMNPGERPHIDRLLKTYLKFDEYPDRTWADMSDDE